ncbi:MAG: DNA-binding transcriptional LysR family regulator [Methylophagaceae bacterium]|jgi:DNA-binding transcriptional LysR family regulator
MALDLQQLVNRLSFRQLQVFSMVYKLRGYRKAADSLGLTQPAVSSQIKKLEQSLGHPLFEYIGRTLYSTEAGERVSQFIESMFVDIAHLQTDLHTLQAELSGDLNLVVVNSAQSIVPYLIKTFSTRYPAIRVRVNVVNRANALKRLEKNPDELTIMALVPNDRSLTVLPFLDNELIPVLPADFKLTGKRPITPQRFLQQPLILREPGSGSRLAFEQHCLESRLSYQSSMVFGSNEAVKHAVISGLGVAVIPKLSVLPELQLGVIKTLDIKGFPLRRTWCLVYPRRKNLTPVSQAFSDYIQQSLAEINLHFNLLTASSTSVT